VRRPDIALIQSQLGVKPGQIKDQFKPNRSNLRRAVEQAFGGV
jgi:hypothetical protein